jgi:hypothetical protein
MFNFSKPLFFILTIFFIIFSFVSSLVFTPFTHAAQPSESKSGAYIILGEDPFFVLNFNGVTEQLPIVKAIYPPPVLVGLQEGKVIVNKAKQKNLVNLVQNLQRIQKQSGGIHKGTLIQVTGPKGRKAQAYLAPDTSSVSDIERNLVKQIEKVISNIQSSQNSYREFYPKCYKMESRDATIQNGVNFKAVDLPAKFNDVVNKPVSISYAEAVSLTNNNNYYQTYTANNEVFNLVFSQVFTYQNISC